MRRVRKIVLWILGIVVAIPALAVAAFFLAPSSLLASRADAWAKEHLGRGLTFTGAFERRLYPTIGADFTGVAVANAPWAASEPLLEAESAAIDVDFLALLGGRLEITQVRLSRPVVRAEIGPDGAANWRFSGSGFGVREIIAIGELAEEIGREVERDSAGRPLRPVLGLARLEGGRVVYRNRQNGKSFEMEDIVVDARSLDTGAVTFEASSTLNGQPTRLNGRLPDLIAVWNGQSDAAMLSFEGEGAKFDFNGDFDLRRDSLSAKGAFEGSLSEDRTRTAWLRRGLPEGWAPLGDVALRGSFDADRGALVFEMSGEAEFNGETVTLEASARGGEDWRRGQPIETAFTLQAAGGVLTATGGGPVHIQNDALHDVALRLEARAPDWAAVRRWADVTPPRRPIGEVGLSAALKGGAGKYQLTEAALAIGDARTVLNLSIDLTGARTRLDGALTEGPLDLNAFASGKPERQLTRLAASNGQPVAALEAERIETAEIAALEEEWSTTPFPLRALDGSDGAFRVDLKGVVIGDLNMGRTGVELTMGAGGVDFAVKEIALYDGRIQGAASLKREGEAARLAARLTMEEVQTQPFLESLGKTNWLRGPISADAEATGAGPHMRALMRSLSGKGSAEMRNGALLALNFAALSLDKKLGIFGAIQKEAGVTPFKRAGLTFGVKDGVLRTKDFKVDSDVVRAEGEGEVNIGIRTVDMVVTPTGFGEISFLGIDAAIARAFPVRLIGPFGAVKVLLDRSRAAPAPVDKRN